MIRLAVLTEYRRVTDGQVNGHLARAVHAMRSIARYKMTCLTCQPAAQSVLQLPTGAVWWMTLQKHQCRIWWPIHTQANTLKLGSQCVQYQFITQTLTLHCYTVCINFMLILTLYSMVTFYSLYALLLLRHSINAWLIDDWMNFNGMQRLCSAAYVWAHPKRSCYSTGCDMFCCSWTTYLEQLTCQSARQGSQLHRIQKTTENIHVSDGLRHIVTFLIIASYKYSYLLTYLLA